MISGNKAKKQYDQFFRWNKKRSLLLIFKIREKGPNWCVFESVFEKLTCCATGLDVYFRHFSGVFVELVTQSALRFADIHFF